MKKNKYDFSNGFVVISDLNETMGIEKYADKLYLVEQFNFIKDDGTVIKETVKTYTAKKYDKTDKKIKKQICERCGNLSNRFFKIYLSYYNTISSFIVCSFCTDTEYGFREIPKFSKLYMKAVKYRGKKLKKFKKEYKKFLKEHKKMLKI